jgi:hypothetical protein
LSPGVTYSFSVRAITPAGLGAPASVTATTSGGHGC